MAELAISGVVEKLSERRDYALLSRSRTEEVIEIIEAVVVALVTGATT